ncbi:MAG: hypothetical protein JXA67_20385 [Micromonosporaceae bacterium]|nr:hypothetical protein [Micromonosporaceae bacterium]
MEITQPAKRDMSKQWEARSKAALQRRLDAAQALLEDHGYTVRKPESKTGR